MGHINDFLKKSGESFEAGEILAVNGLYASAVSRYYYSVYQLVMPIANIFSEKKSSTCKSNGKVRKLGSHEKTIMCFKKFLVKYCFDLNIEKKRVNEIVSKITRLKQERHKADYQPYVINEEDLNFARESALRIRKQIIRHKNKIIRLISIT